jgi:hypothetical protein
MIYPIERLTPAKGLEKISRSTLEEIALKAGKEGIDVKVYD